MKKHQGFQLISWSKKIRTKTFMLVERPVLKKSFTLIELLVVIAIISILMAILLPTLKKAKDLAKTTICANNVKQIGTGVSMYTIDSESYLPAYYDYAGICWPDKLVPYTMGKDAPANAAAQRMEPGKKGIWVCPTGPAFVNQAAADNCLSYWPGGEVCWEYVVTMGTSNNFPPTNNAGFVRYPTIPGSSIVNEGSNRPWSIIKTDPRSALIMDGSYNEWGNATFYFCANNWNDCRAIDTAYRNANYPHSRGANILFADFHVAWKHRSTTMQTDMNNMWVSRE